MLRSNQSGSSEGGTANVVPYRRHRHRDFQLARIAHGSPRSPRRGWPNYLKPAVLLFILGLLAMGWYARDEAGPATIRRGGDLALAPSSAGAYHPSCDAARAAGARSIAAGEPGYRAELDRDADGVACEPWP